MSEKLKPSLKTFPDYFNDPYAPTAEGFDKWGKDVEEWKRDFEGLLRAELAEAEKEWNEANANRDVANSIGLRNLEILMAYRKGQVRLLKRLLGDEKQDGKVVKA